MAFRHIIVREAEIQFHRRPNTPASCSMSRWLKCNLLLGISPPDSLRLCRMDSLRLNRLFRTNASICAFVFGFRKSRTLCRILSIRTIRANRRISPERKMTLKKKGVFLYELRYRIPLPRWGFFERKSRRGICDDVDASLFRSIFLCMRTILPISSTLRISVELDLDMVELPKICLHNPVNIFMFFRFQFLKLKFIYYRTGRSTLSSSFLDAVIAACRRATSPRRPLIPFDCGLFIFGFFCGAIPLLVSLNFARCGTVRIQRNNRFFITRNWLKLFCLLWCEEYF